MSLSMLRRLRRQNRVEAARETAPATLESRKTFIDPQTLMRIKSLPLRAKVVVEGFYNGLHRSPFHGFSVEFSEYRQYTPGDDPRYLDWRLYARSDRYYLKRFEDETNVRCYLLVDLSRSMGFGSLEFNKAEYARTAAATLAYFLAQQRDSVGLMTFHERLGDYLPARFRAGHLHRIMMCLEHALAGERTDLAVPLEEAAKLVRRRGVVVLISDLLAPLATLESKLALLRSRQHEVIVLQILDPAEKQFSFEQPAMFEDVESGRSIYVDPESVREQYTRRFQAHQEAIAQACRNLGIDYVPVTTDQPLELVLFDFLKSRLRRGREVRRRQGGVVR